MIDFFIVCRRQSLPISSWRLNCLETSQMKGKRKLRWPEMDFQAWLKLEALFVSLSLIPCLGFVGKTKCGKKKPHILQVHNNRLKTWINIWDLFSILFVDFVSVHRLQSMRVDGEKKGELWQNIPLGFFLSSAYKYACECLFFVLVKHCNEGLRWKERALYRYRIHIFTKNPIPIITRIILVDHTSVLLLA